MRVLLCALLVCTLISLACAASLGYCRKTSSTFATANSFESSSFDSTTKSLFLGTKSNNPRIIYKLNTPSFPSSTAQTLTSTTDEEGVFVTINDPARGVVYFAGGVDGFSGTITRLSSSTLTELDSLALDDMVMSGVIDTNNGYVYFGTQMGYILKIAVSNFSIVDQIQPSFTGYLTCAIIDESSMFLTHHFSDSIYLLLFIKEGLHTLDHFLEAFIKST